MTLPLICASSGMADYKGDFPGGGGDGDDYPKRPSKLVVLADLNVDPPESDEEDDDDNNSNSNSNSITSAAAATATAPLPLPSDTTRSLSLILLTNR